MIGKNKYEGAIARCELDLEDRIRRSDIGMCGRMDIQFLKELLSMHTKSEKSAKEMFKDLGYEVLYNTFDMERYEGELCYRSSILDETIHFFADGEYVTFEGNIQVDAPLLRAIIQQMKEMGWI